MVKELVEIPFGIVLAMFVYPYTALIDGNQLGTSKGNHSIFHWDAVEGCSIGGKGVVVFEHKLHYGSIPTSCA